MDARPIGVFDSGLGGLTAVRALHDMLPKENILFFGDTKRVPYGEKSPEAITEYASRCLRFLEDRDVKYIIVACGTVSSVLGEKLKTDFKVPVTGVLEPTVKEAVKRTRDGNIAVIATNATIKSGAYERKIHEIDKNISVYSKACPLFVPLVENGYFGDNSLPTKIVAEDYLSEFKGGMVDTMILGCTHYPLLTDIIKDVMGDSVSLINAGYETAKFVADDLRKSNLLSEEENGSITFYVTDRSEGFSALGEKFLGTKLYDVNLVNI